MASVTRLWRLDGGEIQINDLSLFSDTFGYAGQAKRFSVGSYLIEHDKKFMLWEAGLPACLLGAPLGEGAKSASLNRTLVDQLREIGVSPEQIGLLAVSHYHLDHMGQARDFSNATLMMGRADFNALGNRLFPEDTDPDLIRPWLEGQAPVDLVTGDRDVFGDGAVLMLFMPGHTPGNYALLVRLAKTGPVLLSGDAAIFGVQYEEAQVPPSNTDRAQSLASMERLRNAAKALGAMLIIQHEAGDVERLPRFPLAAE